MSRNYEDLVAEASAVSVDGWDFSWLEGRATEERPSWWDQRIMSKRLAVASAALDVQTGGGEVLAGAPVLPPVTAATESRPPNVTVSTRLLRPRGVTVVADPDEPPLPFADAAFDLVVSRHPSPSCGTRSRASSSRAAHTSRSRWVSRACSDLSSTSSDRCPPRPTGRATPTARGRRGEVASLEVLDLRSETLRTEFFDVGAVVYCLPKVIWMVPGFTAEAYDEQLRAMHGHIEREGAFVAHPTRFLIDARRR